MTRARRRVVVLIVLAALAACGHEAPEEVETHAVVPVTTTPVRTGTIRAVISATGVVTPAPGADLVVIAPEPARIAAVPKAEGDRVRKGEVLVRFEIPTVTADAAARSADVERARAELDNARANQARARDLFARGVAARKEVEDADRDAAAAEAAIVQARAARDAANALKDRTISRATFDGVVARRSHNPGDLVEASAADPILRVIDPHRLEVSALVPLGEIARVSAGAAARVTDGAGDAPLALTVVSRPVAVEPGTAAVPVRLAFTEPPPLPAGTPVQVEIDADVHENVLVVPPAAVVHEGQQSAVFVVEHGTTARRRQVTTGAASQDAIEVRSGLSGGEQVITHGQAGLPDGAPVRVEAPGK